MPKGMQPIYRQVLGSNAATVTFNNIPQTFTDLKILINGKSTGGGVGTVYMAINGTTTAINPSVVGYGESSGSGTFTTSPTQGVHVGYIAGTTIDATSTGSTEIFIPNYKSTIWRNIIGSAATEGNNTIYQSAVQSQQAALYQSFLPITQLSFNTETFFATNTSFTLYGIGA
jgi:hypothetical protein